MQPPASLIGSHAWGLWSRCNAPARPKKLRRPCYGFFPLHRPTARVRSFLSAADAKPVLSLAAAKDGGAHADHGGSGCYGLFEIAAHTHAEFCQRKPVPKRRQAFEMRHRILVRGRDTHQSA